MIGPKTELILQRKTESRNSSGFATVTWTPKIKIRGVLSTISGEERAANALMQETTVRTHVFAFRKQPGITITPKDRFLNGAVVYDILSAKNCWDRIIICDLKETTAGNLA